MQGAYFYGTIGAFALGVTASLSGVADMGEAALLLVIAVAGASLSFAVKEKRALVLSVIIAAGFGCGALRAGIYAEMRAGGALDAKVGEQVVLTGMVIRDPVVTARSQKIVIETEGERVITFAPTYPAFSYGDIVEATGALERPEAFETEPGRVFDYPAYLAKEGIRYVLDEPSLEGRGERRGNPVIHAFISARRRFVAALERLVPEPYAGLAAGVVLGVDGALSKEDEETFRDAGLIHVVVVSGYNITLAGALVGRALARAPLLIASLGSFAGIIAFILLTGASATAVRAGIMATLVLLSRMTKRRYDAQRALFLAGFLMVVHVPGILLHDPSFQLSFLATWGLSSLTPITARLVARFPSFLRDVAAATLATQAAVTPLLLHMSGTVSLLSLPANILVLPVIPGIMLSALGVGALGPLPAPVLLPFSAVVHAFGAYVFGVARLTGDIPMSVAHIAPFPVVLLAPVYALMAFVAWRTQRRPPLSAESGGLARD